MKRQGRLRRVLQCAFWLVKAEPGTTRDDGFACALALSPQIHDLDQEQHQFGQVSIFLGELQPGGCVHTVSAHTVHVLTPGDGLLPPPSSPLVPTPTCPQ